MITPTDIIRLRAYEGPNIHGPQPGVLLRISAAADRARRLRDAIRDGAQSVGLVIAYLEADSRPLGDGFLIEARFTTDQPGIGADLCRYIVDGMRAEAAGDEEWDRDGPLYDLQSRRRREATPVPALQLIVEARQRGLPTIAMPDGRIQIGYGARGWSYDPRLAEEAPAPPWGQIGAIPITLVTGHLLRAAAVERRAAEIAAAGFPVRAADGLGFDAIRDLLADPAVDAAVIGLDTDSLILRGLPLDRCEQAVICDMDGPRPDSADDEEWLRALGLPMLLSPNPAQINLADPRLHPLIPYAPNGVLST